jgi:hypothetical protein
MKLFAILGALFAAARLTSRGDPLLRDLDPEGDARELCR